MDAAWVVKTAATQKAMLKKALTLLSAGHEMVYSTCSILPEENARRIRAGQARPLDGVPFGIQDIVEERFYEWGDKIDNNPGDGEVNGGEFFWVLRRAARDASGGGGTPPSSP